MKAVKFVLGVITIVLLAVIATLWLSPAETLEVYGIAVVVATLAIAVKDQHPWSGGWFTGLALACPYSVYIWRDMDLGWFVDGLRIIGITSVIALALSLPYRQLLHRGHRPRFGTRTRIHAGVDLRALMPSFFALIALGLTVSFYLYGRQLDYQYQLDHDGIPISTGQLPPVPSDGKGFQVYVMK